MLASETVSPERREELLALLDAGSALPTGCINCETQDGRTETGGLICHECLDTPLLRV